MKKYLLSIAVLLCGMVSFTSCDNTDIPAPEPSPIDPVLVSKGVFILNEGNYYDKINGSLSYFDYDTKKLTDGLFESANQRSLGGTPNDMVIVGDRMYICSTDENRVEVCNIFTFKSIMTLEIPQPRCICSNDVDAVFVSSYDGTVTRITLDGKRKTKSSKVGENLEGIAFFNGSVYVCNAYKIDESGASIYSNNLVKLEQDTMEKLGEVTVACNPTSLKCSSENLYVLSTGNYFDVQSQLQVISKDEQVKYVCDATLFDVTDTDDVYAANSITDWNTYVTTTEYFRLDKSLNRTQLVSSDYASQIVMPCGIAFDSQSRRLLITSYNKGAWGADYSGKGFLMAFAENGDLIGKYDAGVGPTTLIVNRISE